jgi:hypothetical protein
MNRVDTKMQLIWLRSDLRLHDNTALSAAAARGPCAAVYLLSPEQWLEHDDAPCKVDFWLRNLRALSHELGQLNIPLLIRRAPRWEDAHCWTCAGSGRSTRCTSTRNTAFMNPVAMQRSPGRSGPKASRFTATSINCCSSPVVC